MKIQNETVTARAVSMPPWGKSASPFFMCFLGFFRKMGGVTAQHGNGCDMNRTERRGSDGSKYRSRDAGGHGEKVLPQLWCGGQAKQ